HHMWAECVCVSIHIRTFYLCMFMCAYLQAQLSVSVCGRVHSPCVWICVYSDVCVCVHFPLLSGLCSLSSFPLLSSPLRSVQSLLLSFPLLSSLLLSSP